MYLHNCNFLVVALAALDEYYVGTRAHNPGEASNFLVPIACPYISIFTNQFIFRSIFPRILNIEKVLQMSHRKSETRLKYF